MNADQEKFAHALLFRCEACNKPATVSFLTTERNVEDVDGNTHNFVCECGRSESKLGLDAVRHWVVEWN